jgi:plastocyanin
MNRRTFLRVTAGVGMASGIAGCVGGSAQSASEYDIGMSASEFRPASLTVSAGTTVVWRNTSKQGHTVTAYVDGIPEDAEYFASGGFDSEDEARNGYANSSAGVLGAGETFEHEFRRSGTYAYVCLPHERVGMAGTIDVE